VKVCMVAYAYYFTDARIKAYVKSLLARNSQVDVISLREPGNARRYETRGLLNLYYVSSKFMGANRLKYVLSYIVFFLQALVRLSVMHFKRRYDVVHVHNMPNFIVFAAVVPRLYGARVILDMHDIASQNYQEKFRTYDFTALLLELEEQLSTQFAHFIICADDFQRNFLEHTRKIHPDKIAVIMNYPDRDLFTPALHGAKQEHTYNIVYHGTITHRLGLDIIVRAIAIVRDQFDVRLYLYGLGDYVDKCWELVKENGLRDVVHMTRAFFEVEDIPRLLGNKHCGVIGNRRSAISQFMIPVKMLEYMAMGIPVVVPRLENIAYYVSDQEVLFYEPGNAFDLANKISYLHEHPDKAERLVAQALTFVEKHNWQSEADKYLHLISSQVNTRGRRR
jgi:glycosyltransferase involved in cell wall biosynthesis